MGYRLSKIYTRTGDQGTTALADGKRLDKDHNCIHAFGDVDELNSLLGILIAHDIDKQIKEYLLSIQHRLFDIGGEIALPNHNIIKQQHVASVEQLIDKYNANLPPLKEFILPGGSIDAAICHSARAVCRRAERQLVSLHKEQTINKISLQFLNRLSDLLFIFARVLARSNNGQEVYWKKEQAQQ